MLLREVLWAQWLTDNPQDAERIKTAIENCKGPHTGHVSYAVAREFGVIPNDYPYRSTIDLFNESE
ncbi:hypothetical protein D6810_00265 [Candidatus Dojkabacteria bacterium]|uniref:Uncharacterized protein n=1 Tax=Candidatus Dojkabacteria bacterium TaxID=2099670 RepID=A0A3M0Z415_9BACT|nr:MAG: hypothetical protein D6810_00265 [Candidatus Dojkabacteria bacterium]